MQWTSSHFVSTFYDIMKSCKVFMFDSGYLLEYQAINSPSNEEMIFTPIINETKIMWLLFENKRQHKSAVYWIPLKEWSLPSYLLGDNGYFRLKS